MLSPTSMSAMSIERISNAVPASRPFASTVREMLSGFSSTSLWSSAEPIVVTMPSPTRAMIVSSVAPPTSRGMFVRTVTRAFTWSWMPFLATAAMTGLPNDRVRDVDDLGVDGRLDGLEHVAAGEVDRGRRLERQLDPGAVGGDHRRDDLRDVAAGEVVRLELAARRRRCRPGRTRIFALTSSVGSTLRRLMPMSSRSEIPAPLNTARM